MRYVYDIETFSQSLDDVIVDGKYKPNPPKERIICISLLAVNGSQHKPVSIAGMDEKDILTRFWNMLQNGDELCGFNSNSFDWQNILVRTYANGVKIPIDISTLKLTDLRNILYPFNVFMRGTLSDFAALIGIKAESYNGSYMRQFVLDGKWEEIKKHCNEDVFLTYKLYERLKECNLIK